MRLVVHREIPDDASLGVMWNALVREMDCPEIFYTYEWSRSVQQAFAGAVRPLLFLAYDESALVGVAALATDPEGKTTRFLAGPTADYCDFISSNKLRLQFISAVLAELRKLKCPSLVFANVPADSSSCSTLAASPEHGYYFFSRPAYVCAQVTVVSANQRSLAKQSVERRLRRFEKAMPREAKVSVSHSVSTVAIEEAFADFATAHVARFLSLGKISNLVHAARRNFLLALTRSFSSSNSVVLSRLMSGDHPIAWNFGFRFAGSWFWYQPTLDPQYHLYSPGVWLLSAIVSEACDSPNMNRVDLGLGAESYKERLANSFRQTLHFTASRSLGAHSAAVLRYNLATVVKSAPKLENLIRAAQTICHSALSAKKSGDPISKWRSSLVSRRRMLYLEWDSGNIPNSALSPPLDVRQIDLNLLARVAMQYEDDKETLDYLLDAARHFASGAKGLALVDDSETLLYFCWITNFVLPLEIQGNESTACILISPAWSPPPARRTGSEAMALRRICTVLNEEGNKIWAIASMANDKEILEFERAGFAKRFSVKGGRHFARTPQGSAATYAAPSEHDTSSAA